MSQAAWRSFWGVFGGLLALAGGLTAWMMFFAPSTPSSVTRKQPPKALSGTGDTILPGQARLDDATATGGRFSARDMISPAGFMRGPSGGWLPRFMTVVGDGVAVRLGPGRDYPVAWIIRAGGMPLEVMAEAGDWLRVRDHEGEEGWLHIRALSGDYRAALVAPWRQDAKVALHAERSADAPLRAWVAAGVVVRLLACDGQWCRVRAGEVEGWLEQAQLWGVYRHERIRVNNN